MPKPAAGTSVTIHDPSARFVEPKRYTKIDERDSPRFYQFSITKPWTGVSTTSHSNVQPYSWSPDHEITAQRLRKEFHTDLDLSIVPETEVSTASHPKVRPHDWSPDHEITAQYLREELHIGPEVPLNLSIVPDPQAGEKPRDQRKLVELAIFGSRQHKITVAEIYDALRTRFTCYRSLSKDETEAWKVNL